jgi:hypothetical protein
MALRSRDLSIQSRKSTDVTQQLSYISSGMGTVSAQHMQRTSTLAPQCRCAACIGIMSYDDVVLLSMRSASRACLILRHSLCGMKVTVCSSANHAAGHDVYDRPLSDAKG